MIRIFKEPLLHFLAAGAVLFGAHTWLNRGKESPSASKERQIHLTADHVQWLAETWTSQWRRPPTREELRGLVVHHLDEQLLAREARALGLDDNDVIVQRRLAQKLTFLLEGTLLIAEPSQDELQRLYERHADRFRVNPHISFVHIYFNPQRRTDARSDAEGMLKRLLAAGEAPPIAEIGDRTLLPAEFHDETEQTISRVLGADFAQAVFSLEPGSWNGPVASGYGLHLVRVSSLRGAQLPSLSEVRARLIEEWRSEQDKIARKRYLAELRQKYGIVADEIIETLIERQIALKRPADE